ncbi:hypothetical protein [uncultured Aquimarina sp.]|uniref:hypothetical protein n=1 Tax=uncultured Aquimarina sp. TaxID=575652 RepID=UPI00263687BB|nr:hypothetical protein [uncultured Aquimarina sp.]
MKRFKLPLLSLFAASLFLACSTEEQPEEPKDSNKGNIIAINVYPNVTFKTLINSLYVSSENGEKPVQADRTQTGSWENFIIEHLGGNKVAIKGNNGKYLSSGNAMYPLTCNTQNIGDWEVFGLESLGNDYYAIKGSNNKYVIYDHSGDKLLWSTSYNIGDAEIFLIKGVPSTPFGLNSIQLIKDDMRLPHQGYPSGVPIELGWALQPRISYGNNPPDDWRAMFIWGQVYTDPSGNPSTNTRFQIRNLQAWYLSKTDGKWRLWEKTSSIAGANYAEDFQGDINIPADIRDESNNGGGISSTLRSGFNFHFWPNKNRISIDPNDIAGVWVSMESRLVVNEINKPDDRRNARMMLSAGADYWSSLTAEWDQWKTNGDIGIGRFRYITEKWQVFNMHTLSDAQLANNPPPFDN